MKILFTSLLALCAALSTVSASPLRTPSSSLPIITPPSRRDADFQSVRTKLDRNHSGKKDAANKYFHESTFHPHYDGRFASRPLPYEEKRTHLTALMQTYLSTMNDIGAETWIMHGSLLGWFWSRKVMPWDSDLDVQMSEPSMKHLANYYNMTIHHFKLPGIPDGRDYMLEVNPNWHNGSVTDKMNVIDARWIDTDTGLFIDITTLRNNETAQAMGHTGYMMCKDRHHYNFTDIFPLRESLFEDTPVKIPYAYTDLLIEEYGHKALVVRDYENHHFDQTTMEWIPIKPKLKNGQHVKVPSPHDAGYRGAPAKAVMDEFHRYAEEQKAKGVNSLAGLPVKDIVKGIMEGGNMHDSKPGSGYAALAEPVEEDESESDHEPDPSFRDALADAAKAPEAAKADEEGV